MTGPNPYSRSWKSALLTLVTSREASDRMAAREATRQISAATAPEQTDDDREPFHLDDAGVADLVRRPRAADYRTPPHAYLLFPTLPQR